MKDLLKHKKTGATKEKIGLQKLNFIKIETSPWKLRKTQEWEKITANYIPKKEQIFRKYKDLSQLNNKKTYGKRFRQTPYQRNMNEKYYIERYSVSLTREMQKTRSNIH